MMLIWEEENGKCWAGLSLRARSAARLVCPLTRGFLRTSLGALAAGIPLKCFFMTKGWSQMYSKWDHWGPDMDASQTRCGRQIQEHTQEFRKWIVHPLRCPTPVIACDWLRVGSVKIKS